MFVFSTSITKKLAFSGKHYLQKTFWILKPQRFFEIFGVFNNKKTAYTTGAAHGAALQVSMAIAVCYFDAFNYSTIKFR
jgi:hypothetical protein